MECTTSKWHFLKLDLRKVIVILLLFGTPHILKLFGLTMASQYVLTNYLIYPVLIIIVIVFGIPFASPTNLPGWYQALAGIVALVTTPIIYYILICALIALWDDIFDRLCGSGSKICQRAILVILLIPFIYSAIYIPSLTASRFKVKKDVRSKISISADPKTFYDENGPFEKYILKEFIVRNDNDFEMKQSVPQSDGVMCLYDTKSGSLARYNGYYADEKGHGFVDPPNWNNVVVEPKSEARYYLLGDMTLSDRFDQILIPKDSYWPPNKDCSELTKGDIEAGIATGAEIIRITK